jgi:DNA-binding XRE family transcriptional regulator
MLTLRKSIRLTQAGLADLLGVSRRAAGEWEAYQVCRSESSAQSAESFAALPRIT